MPLNEASALENGFWRSIDARHRPWRQAESCLQGNCRWRDWAVQRKIEAGPGVECDRSHRQLERQGRRRPAAALEAAAWRSLRMGGMAGSRMHGVTRVASKRHIVAAAGPGRIRSPAPRGRERAQCEYDSHGRCAAVRITRLCHGPRHCHGPILRRLTRARHASNLDRTQLKEGASRKSRKKSYCTFGVR